MGLQMAEFSDLEPNILEIAVELQNLILGIFPNAITTSDSDNIGFGFGSVYKDLVFIISPYKEHVNLGIVKGADLEDPHNLMAGKGKVHMPVKLQRIEQVRSPELKELLLRALQAAQNRIQ